MSIGLDWLSSWLVCNDTRTSCDGFEGSVQAVEPKGLGSLYSDVCGLLRSQVVGWQLFSIADWGDAHHGLGG